jgi:hypothetical protein
MSVARITEITSQSDQGFDHAIRSGIERATRTLQNVEHVWIKDQEIQMKNNKVTAYRVTMKVTFVLND